MRGAAEITSVWTAQPGQNLSGARYFNPEYFQPAHQQRMPVRHLDFRLAEQPPKKRDAFLAADMVSVWLEDIVLQHSAVAPKHNFTLWRVFADQRDRFLHLMHHRH